METKPTQKSGTAESGKVRKQKVHRTPQQKKLLAVANEIRSFGLLLRDYVAAGKPISDDGFIATGGIPFACDHAYKMLAEGCKSVNGAAK